MKITKLDKYQNNYCSLYVVSYINYKNSGGRLLLLDVDLHLFDLKVHGVTKRNRRCNTYISKINNIHKKKQRPGNSFLKKLGLLKVSDSLKKSKKGVFAINGGFFLDYGSLDTSIFSPDSNQSFYGDPIGWLRIDGYDFSIPFLNRPILKIFQNNTFKISHTSIINNEVSINKKTFFVKNENLIKNSSSLENFIKKNTDDITHYSFILITNNTIVSVSRNPSPIPSNSMVLVIKNNEPILTTIHSGDTIVFIDPDNALYCLTMGPTLLENGIYSTNRIWQKEDFGTYYYPKTLTRDLFRYHAARTGIFTTNSNNRLFLVVSENNKTGYGEGLTLNEFAHLTVDVSDRLNLNFCNGYYLDGGSSSILCYKKSREVLKINCPSGISNPFVKGPKRGQESFVGIVVLIEQKYE